MLDYFETFLHYYIWSLKWQVSDSQLYHGTEHVILQLCYLVIYNRFTIVPHEKQKTGIAFPKQKQRCPYKNLLYMYIYIKYILLLIRNSTFFFVKQHPWYIYPVLWNNVHIQNYAGCWQIFVHNPYYSDWG